LAIKQGESGGAIYQWLFGSPSLTINNLINQFNTAPYGSFAVLGSSLTLASDLELNGELVLDNHLAWQTTIAGPGILRLTENSNLIIEDDIVEISTSIVGSGSIAIKSLAGVNLIENSLLNLSNLEIGECVLGSDPGTPLAIVGKSL
jgi:hypothetical protein